MVIYLRQEGRGIGLFNKVNAYSLQDLGHDTMRANELLGFKQDYRKYEIVDEILKYFNIKKIKLMTNNPLKLNSLKEYKLKTNVQPYQTFFYTRSIKYIFYHNPYYIPLQLSI